MKIGITGDTHGSKQAIRQVLHAVPPVEYWFHTGDYSQDGRFLVAETKLPLLAVCGNTDPGEGKANVDEFITLAGQHLADPRTSLSAWVSGVRTGLVGA